ncbi:DUF397 domain-containing protein [Streptomyces sp. SID5785]|uniref:DUF397 domain-containing protein n=1 Tax=Streptomyces sp. SID5785 TaxID=2690309 RepID=UPI001361BB30|nr:DUF397 domain-containing protein [Streptomyces sp. SID5785]MZD06600.1 DUF397 domain-containing protein [Streptomyces sp. SID5785]
MSHETTAGYPTELSWFKSSYSSGGSEPDCVEIAHTPGTTHVRDSKNGDGEGPRLSLSRAAWSDFLSVL